jgi:hypothetical protein
LFWGVFFNRTFLADFFGAAAFAFLADFFADFLAFFADFLTDLFEDFFADFFFAVRSFLFFLALAFLPFLFFLPLAIVIPPVAADQCLSGFSSRPPQSFQVVHLKVAQLKVVRLKDGAN